MSARQAAARLRALGVAPESLNAVLVTHEHCDHINGISVLSRRFRIPVYANHCTAEYLEHKVFGIERFETGRPFDICGMRISPFSIVHDAVDPVGFAVRADGLRLVQATDLGKVTPLVRDAAMFANALVLEFNHDLQMLQDCHYPWELKQRIASAHGHLSNWAAAELVGQVLHSALERVVLGHISENSNTPELAVAAARAVLGPAARAAAVCANPYQATELFQLGLEPPAIAVSA